MNTRLPQRVTRGNLPFAPRRRPQTPLRRASQPVVAAVNGACTHVGFVRALMHDVQFASVEARWTASALIKRQQLLDAEQGLERARRRAVGYLAYVKTFPDDPEGVAAHLQGRAARFPPLHAGHGYLNLNVEPTGGHT